MTQRQYVKWTRDDLVRLARCYPVMSSTDLEREFAPRSLDSIRGKAASKGYRKTRNWRAIAAAHKPVIFGARKAAKVDA